METNRLYITDPDFLQTPEIYPPRLLNPITLPYYQSRSALLPDFSAMPEVAVSSAVSWPRRASCGIAVAEARGLHLCLTCTLVRMRP